MALRVAPLQTPETGRSFTASSGHWPLRQTFYILLASAAIWLDHTYNVLAASHVTIIAAAALLVFGLPHGTLDIAVVRRGGAILSWITIKAVALYLGCALAMYGLWLFSTTAALIIFLLVACVHFAEDWSEDLPAFFAIGTAVALLSAPSLFHRETLEPIFALLVGTQSASTFVDIGILIAPIALLTTLVGIMFQWQGGNQARAVETAITIAAMLLLPPIPAFALYFCLSHSPVQFAKACSEAGHETAWWKSIDVVLLTAAALGISAMIFADQNVVSWVDGVVVTSFITLSVLTVPHMVVPFLIDKMATRRRAIA